MTTKSRYFTPSRTYEFVLKIGDVDLTPDLIKLTIVTSIKLPYQTFILDLYADSMDIIKDKIYGQKPINLTANLFGTSQFPLETIKFELMYLESNIKIDTKVQIPERIQKDRDKVSFTAVSRAAYKTMNTYVNAIYNATSINSAITDLVRSTGAAIEYDSGGQNPDTIDQMLIPPDTLYKNLNYINRTWGIFDGCPTVSCTHDNKVQIKNITDKMNQAETFVFYQLAIDADNRETIEKCDDGKHYYTTKKIITSYEGNSVMALVGPKILYMVKPRNSLTETIDVVTENVAQFHSATAKGSQTLSARGKVVYYDETAIDPNARVNVKTNHTGYDKSEIFIHGALSKPLSEITTMSVRLERTMKLLNLMNVGEPIQVVSKISTTKGISGKYILETSELSFMKAKDWESSASLNLIRTNRVLT